MEQVVCVSFNENGSCLSVGTSSGLRVYQCLPFRKYFDSLTHVGVGVCTQLYNSSLAAIVGSGHQIKASPRTVRLINLQNTQTIVTLNFQAAVLTLRLAQTRLVAVTHNKIHVFELSSMQKLVCFPTKPNPQGVCAIHSLPDSEQCLLAFPSAKSHGSIHICDAASCQVIHLLKAHETQVRTLAFNSDGTMLATTSEKGTIVRVFSVQEGTLLYTFRRGVKQTVILSLSFSEDGLHLLALSKNSTVHIFRLQKNDSANVSGLLPKGLKNAVEPPKAIAKIRVKSDSQQLMAAFQGSEDIHVVSEQGYLFTYRLQVDGDVVDSVLVEEHALFDVEDVLGVELYDENDQDLLLQDLEEKLDVNEIDDFENEEEKIDEPNSPEDALHIE